MLYRRHFIIIHDLVLSKFFAIVSEADRLKMCLIFKIISFLEFSLFLLKEEVSNPGSDFSMSL